MTLTTSRPFALAWKSCDASASNPQPEDDLRARVRRVPIEEIARAAQLRVRRVLG